MKNLLKNSISSLFKNKIRTLLTSLGIIIGTSSVIVMIGIGQGSQEIIDKQIEAMGTNLLQIMPQHSYGTNANFNPSLLTSSDLEKVKNEAVYISGISGVVASTFTVQGTKGSGSVTVTGVEEDYIDIKNRSILEGEFFDEEDDVNFKRMAVLGTTTANNLFGSIDDIIGQSVQVGSSVFTVKGIVSPIGTSGGRDQDDLFFIPLSTYENRLSSIDSLDSIAVSVKSKSLIDAATKDLIAIMREAHSIKENASDDFSIMNSADVLSVATNTAKTLTVLLSAIAAISLLVGGIGIMNIMLVSVTERIHEIGILMSIGANKKDILLEFLTESATISFAGGVIGIIISVIIAIILNNIGVPTIINLVVVLMSTGFAIIIGVFFGFYPAYKASNLKPIEALRYE